MSRCFAVVLLISGLGLAACGGGDRTAAASNPSSQKEERRGGAESLTAREVRVVRAETGNLSRTVVVSGTLAADEEAGLGPKVAGRLTTLSVDLGDHVRRGQVLARLSPTDFELRVRQAANALQQARAQLGLPADPARGPWQPEEGRHVEHRPVHRIGRNSLFTYFLRPPSSALTAGVARSGKRRFGLHHSDSGKGDRGRPGARGTVNASAGFQELRRRLFLYQRPRKAVSSNEGPARAIAREAESDLQGVTGICEDAGSEFQSGSEGVF